ncbi:MAG: methyl-accepting chemotaxis protein [Planctomycetota bacterium]
MRWTIGRRLWLGFGLALGLVGTMSALSYLREAQNTATLTTLSDLVVDSTAGTESQAAMLMMRMNVKDYLLTNSEKDLAEYADWRGKFEESMRVAETFENPDRVVWIDQISKQFAAYDQHFAAVQGVIQKRNRLISDTIGPVGADARKELESLRDKLHAHQDYASSQHASQAAVDLMLARYYSRQYILTGDQSAYDRAWEEFESGQALVAQLVKSVENADDRAQAKTLETRLAEYGSAVQEVRVLRAERDRLVYDHLDVIGPQVASLWADVTHSLERDSEALAYAAKDASAKAQNKALLLGAAGLFIALFSAWFITRSILRPLKGITERLTDIAEGEGDLTQRVEIKGRDELAVLASKFNAFSERVHDTVAEVAGATREVASTSEQIAAAASELSAGIDEQSSQVAQVSAAIEEMSSSVIEVAGKAADATRQAERSGEEASQGGVIVAETVTGMQGIDEAVSASAASVQELGKRGEQIGAVITVINDIADQTNLLALNAAIEAARAGEHGRGFAVVADEVRKLADRTVKATEEISESIQSIQNETGLAVDRMSAGTEQVKHGVELASQAGDSLTSIVTGAREVAAVIGSIAAAAEEQSAAAEQVSQSVQSIEQITRQSQDAASQSAQSAELLARRSDALQGLVNRFRIDESRLQ